MRAIAEQFGLSLCFASSASASESHFWIPEYHFEGNVVIWQHIKAFLKVFVIVNSTLLCHMILWNALTKMCISFWKSAVLPNRVLVLSPLSRWDAAWWPCETRLAPHLASFSAFSLSVETKSESPRGSDQQLYSTGHSSHILLCCGQLGLNQKLRMVF